MSIEDESKVQIAGLASDGEMRDLSMQWMLGSARHRYTYNFRWLGRPVIQFPQDLVALQELIWTVRPSAIVETGIAHGGSLVFCASMLQLIGGDGIVVGVDVDIRAYNREAIESHPMAHRIRMVEGSSIDPGTVRQVEDLVAGRQPVMVILDSMHTHDHVLAELEAYSPLVRAGSWLVVLDTVIEDMPKGWFTDRPWDVGNNPKTAVHEFLRRNDRFAIDPSIADKLQITVAPDGWLRCVRD
jgi:cephalosporin hydroxylase